MGGCRKKEVGGEERTEGRRAKGGSRVGWAGERQGGDNLERLEAAGGTRAQRQGRGLGRKRGVLLAHLTDEQLRLESSDH